MNPLYHERFPNTPGIYKITCTITGKYYVGSAINLRNRRKGHVDYLQRNIHKNPKLQAAWNKYGPDAFIFDILEIVLIPEMLTAREQYWFDTLKPFGKRGYNIAPVAGSSLGVKYTPEGCQHISEAKRGKPSILRGRKQSPEAIERLRQANIGRKHTEETKRNMGNARRGKKHTMESREKIRQASLGHTVSPETGAKIAAANRGRITSDATRALMHANRAGRPHPNQRKTLIVTSPDGIEYTVTGIKQFCQEHSLDPSSLMRTAKGFDRGKAYTQHKGWKARFPD